MRALAHLKNLKLGPTASLAKPDQLEILRIRNQPDIRNNMYTNHVIGEAEHYAWLDRISAAADAEFYVVYFNDKIAGGVSLSAISRQNGRADWAFYLDESTRGQGLGTALEFKFLDYAFSEAKLQKLNCEVLEFNKPILAMHRRFGFLDEGFRRNHILRDERAWGTHLLGITSEEWATQRARMIDPAPRDERYYLDVIDQIEQMRGRNNRNWMDLLRLSFRHAPKEAADIVAEIYNHDHDISALTRELVRE